MQARSRPGADPLRLLQFSDLHLRGEAGGRVRGVATLETFRRCLAHAARTTPGADALLLTGDLVQDDPGGYRHLAAALRDSRVPVHCLPGNHDPQGALAGALTGPPFDLSPSARYGDWAMLLLDTSVPGATHGALGAAALRDLDARLAALRDAHVLLCLHHQPVPIGSLWLDRVGLRDGAELLALAQRHGHVRGLLWGHVHQAYDARQDGLQLMGTPSTCFQFAPGLAGFAIDGRPPGYRRLELHADGRIETAVVWLPAAAS